MAKKIIIPEVQEIKSELENNNLIIGTTRTIKLLKEQKVSKVFYCSNVPDGIKEDITYYCNLFNVEHVQLSKPNTELGVICRKPFSISVLAVWKK